MLLVANMSLVFNCDDLIDKKFEKLKKDYIEENAYSLRLEWANE